ncbi:ATP-grasp fold amidoligase family protein [Butyrivibrio sp. MC2013]|uniref:ATP-grasp fold amidoligase family protein n=1 Tax=Butyrivibrio sp. MC2013 TaxID=1280686 RepID=UPI000687A7DC|nr:ATP-grasp fold amidoligase family protein [Butyrivibrio sp. MC2013]
MTTATLKYILKSHLPSFLLPYAIKRQYRNVTGRECDLKNPVTFTDKIQWAKLNRRDPIIARLSDKIAVRDFIADKIGDEYLVPVIGGPYKRAEEIDFDALPDSFVLKANHGCGSNLVVRDKSSIDRAEVIRTANGWLSHNLAYDCFEMQYRDIEPRLYIEENLLKEGMTDLPDYKFFCFAGKVFCLYVMADTYPVHTNARVGILDRDFKLMPYRRAEFRPMTEAPEKPRNYELMVEIAQKLSAGFSHVRVDLYNVDGHIYFGEMTFSTGAGKMTYDPPEFDRILGDQWDLTAGV